MEPIAKLITALIITQATFHCFLCANKCTLHGKKYKWTGCPNFPWCGAVFGHYRVKQKVTLQKLTQIKFLFKLVQHEKGRVNRASIASWCLCYSPSYLSPASVLIALVLQNLSRKHAVIWWTNMACLPCLMQHKKGNFGSRFKRGPRVSEKARDASRQLDKAHNFPSYYI